MVDRCQTPLFCCQKRRQRRRRRRRQQRRKRQSTTAVITLFLLPVFFPSPLPVGSTLFQTAVKRLSLLLPPPSTRTICILLCPSYTKMKRGVLVCVAQRAKISSLLFCTIGRCGYNGIQQTSLSLLPLLIIVSYQLCGREALFFRIKSGVFSLLSGVADESGGGGGKQMPPSLAPMRRKLEQKQMQIQEKGGGEGGGENCIACVRS